jgi:hypothetical protein
MLADCYMPWRWEWDTMKAVGQWLSVILLAPPDLPFHTQAIVNTSCVIWIGEESFLFYKQSKAH